MGGGTEIVCGSYGSCTILGIRKNVFLGCRRCKVFENFLSMHGTTFLKIQLFLLDIHLHFFDIKYPQMSGKLENV